jgi:hypothetical protein
METARDTARLPDPLLIPYFEAADDDTARRLLEALVASHADPVVRGVLGRHFEGEQGAAAGKAREAERLHAQAMLLLGARLRGLRRAAPRDGEPRPADPAEAEILHDLRAHAAQVAQETYQAWVRRRYPRRMRLRNRLRYLLSHDPRFDLKEEPGTLVCSLTSGGGLPGLTDGPGSIPAGAAKLARVASDYEIPASDLSRLASQALAKAGGPLDLERLADLVIEKCGLSEPIDRLPVAAALDREGGADVAGLDPADRRDVLRRLWDEILLLPRLQRAVVLLNLKDGDGHGVIGLLPATGIAGIRRIATAIGQSAERFAAMWKELPLDDPAIANGLGVTRAQVTHLRKSAIQRIARRLQIAPPGAGRERA